MFEVTVSVFFSYYALIYRDLIILDGVVWSIKGLYSAGPEPFSKESFVHGVAVHSYSDLLEIEWLTRMCYVSWLNFSSSNQIFLDFANMKPGRLDTDLKIFEFRNSQHTVSNHLDTHLIISGTDLKIPSYIETCGRIDFLRTDFFVSPPPP